MYEDFYKLRGKPFRLTPDPDMLFPSSAHKRAMSYLLYGLEQGEGFVMITGAVGTGKTLLIQKLADDLARRNIAIATIASANLDGEDVLPAVASAFGLPFEGRAKESLLHDVREHLVRVGARHSHALLVVDEAQTLTPAALEMLRILSNLEQRGRALLQVFLIGQSELRSTIVDNHMEQLRQRIVASYRLEPLGHDETRCYILFRLNAVGWAGDPSFDIGVATGVWRASHGIPRKVNLIMDRLMLYGYLEEKHTLDEAALATVIEEMREEMPEAQATLEPVVIPHQPVTGGAATGARADDADQLELKRRTDLVDLMREEVRLRELLRDTAGAERLPPETEGVRAQTRVDRR